MKEVERPAPILMAALNHDFDGVGNAAVGFVIIVEMHPFIVALQRKTANRQIY